MLFPINSFVLFLKVPLERQSRPAVQVFTSQLSQESIIQRQKQNA